eukprot:CAMPEP_0201555908 /NCGR_PEP_ID=MMETSP0173_2-20130828/52052_1 /ASSEMBLY_ACC=CAM_ASM_000268 /TAXON_ID=218659 /ORGANISM="Vexillifera sp., Strain DIVA3 564/2" /LENGTH=1040 /DNA_ID=CAMNT_0047967921 /DNA_START=43 /DNA_END=3166 /DNA_ORIENTATION=+
MEKSIIQIYTLLVKPGSIKSVEHRGQVENQLRQLEHQPGYVTSLLKLLSNKTLDESVLQFGAIRFKRCVEQAWASERRVGVAEKELKKYIRISDQEKEVVRKHIFSVTLKCHPLVQKQMFCAIYEIAEYDFPSKWGNILGEIGQTIKASSNDPNKLAASLECLLILFRCFQFALAGSKRRDPLEHMVVKTFPTLLIVYKEMAKIKNNIQAIHIQKLVARIFFAGTHNWPPRFFLDQGMQRLDEWFSMFCSTLAAPFPPNMPSDMEVKRAWPPWKLRKWILHIFCRFIGRWVNPRSTAPESHTRYAHYVMQKFAEPMLKCVLKYLDMARSAGVFTVPRRIIQALFNFVDSAWRKKVIYEKLRPHLFTVLIDCMFPFICFQKKDLQEWNSDPHEYIRSTYNPAEAFYDPRVSAVNVSVSILKKKHDDFLKQYMDRMLHYLKEFTSVPPQQRTLAQAGRVYGCFTMLGMCRRPIIRDPNFKNSIGPLLATFALPAMRSRFPFIRAKAVWVFSNFYDMFGSTHPPAQQSSPSPAQQQFLKGVQQTLALFGDKELPVRHDAALAIRLYLQNYTSRQLFAPNLGNLLKSFFAVMNEVDSDELVSSLEALIYEFKDEIQPYAGNLAVQLSKEFHRTLACIQNGDEDDKALAASELMRTMLTVLASTRQKPEIYPQMEGPILAVVARVCSQDMIDYFEEGIQLLSFLTYFGPQVTPKQWQFFPKMIEIGNSWGTDFVPEIFPLLDNYVIKSTNVFASQENYSQMLFGFWQKVMGGNVGQEPDANEGCKVIESVFQYCRRRDPNGGIVACPHIDKFVPSVFERVQYRLGKEIETKNFKVVLWVLISDLFYYNPMLCMQYLASKNIIGDLLNNWLASLSFIKRVYDQKTVCVGLTSLLEVPFTKWPAPAQAFLPKIIRAIIKLIWEMNEKVQKIEEAKQQKQQAVKDTRAASSGNPSAYGSSSDDDVDGDYRQDLSDLSLAEIKAIADDATARLASGEFSDDDEESFLIDFDEEVSSESTLSPMDKLDELAFFIQHFQTFSKRDAAPIKN